MELFHRCGRYTLIRKIANGGMAEVLLARQDGPEGFAKDVAIKRLVSDNENDHEAWRALIDEAKALMHVRHQNIVEVYELGEEDGRPFIAMEYVRGVDAGRILNDMLQGRIHVPRAHALHIVARVLEGLHGAHSAVCTDGRPLHIVHRDISPPNVLCSFSGEVKVADFGIAQGMHRERHTTACKIKGKYAYMAPEQIGGKTIDVRTDVAAVGIILFEFLSRARLFGGAGEADAIDAVNNWKIPFERIAEQPRELRGICMRALARRPARRYQHAAAFLADLNRFMVASGASILPAAFGAWLRQHYGDCRGLQNIAGCEDPKACAYNDTRIMSAAFHPVKGRSALSAGALARRIVAVLVLSLACGALPAGIPPTSLRRHDVDTSAHAPRASIAPATVEEVEKPPHKRRKGSRGMGTRSRSVETVPDPQFPAPCR